jgi:hypothetical protein
MTAHERSTPLANQWKRQLHSGNPIGLQHPCPAVGWHTIPFAVQQMSRLWRNMVRAATRESPTIDSASAAVRVCGAAAGLTAHLRAG